MARFGPSSQALKLIGLLGVLPALLLAGCSSEIIRDEDGTVVNAGSWSVFDLRPGDCIVEGTAETDMVPLVPCDEPHSHEVFAVIASSEQSYPGIEALVTFADVACLTVLGDYGVELTQGVAFSYLVPTERTWQEDNDRAIACVLVFSNGQARGSVVAGTADL
jgi:hypothetical protein